MWLFGSFFASIAWNDSEQCKKKTTRCPSATCPYSPWKSAEKFHPWQIQSESHTWPRSECNKLEKSKADQRPGTKPAWHKNTKSSDTCHICQIKPECFHTLAVGKSQNATAQRASLSAILQKHRSLALGQHPPRPNNGGRDVESSTSQREFINFQWYSKHKIV